MQQVRRALKHAKVFWFSYKKNCCANITSLQKKTIRNSCNPKELPIYFSMIKKMPLNILQQKLQIYTQTGSSRGQWSHWFVCFSVHPVHPPPPIQKLHPNYRFKTNYSTKLLIFHNLALVWRLRKLPVNCNLTRTSTQNHEKLKRKEWI